MKNKNEDNKKADFNIFYCNEKILQIKMNANKDA